MSAGGTTLITCETSLSGLTSVSLAEARAVNASNVPGAAEPSTRAVISTLPAKPGFSVPTLQVTCRPSSEQPAPETVIDPGARPSGRSTTSSTPVAVVGGPAAGGSFSAWNRMLIN